MRENEGEIAGEKTKQEKKNRCLPHFSQLSGSAHVPLRSVHPPFCLSVHSFCPMALASIWFPSVWFIPSSPPVCPSSRSVHLSIATVHPPVLSICPSALPFHPVSSTSLCVHFPSLNQLSSFLSFRAGHLASLDLSPLKIFFFWWR